MIYNELKQRGTLDFPIEIHHVDKNHSKYYMSAHWHNEMEIIRILEGKIEVKLNNRTYLAKAGNILFVNPETVHSAEPFDCVYECIVFNMEIFHTNTYSCRFFAESIMNREYMIEEFNSGEDAVFFEAVNSVFEQMKTQSSGYKFLVISTLFRLFGLIVDKHLYGAANVKQDSFDEKNLPRLKKILAFIRDNYGKQIELADIAREGEMSTKYLCYFFKKMTGQTPIGYLNDFRIEKATQQLTHTDLRVTDIALSCGFNDLSYFIKTFKSAKGISPTAFKKEHQKMF
ncbi:MAG: helix-turn-helix transcriptional regulator [Clostridia bacterium]|nr:helix-turn-helix transcriptional regulator [Clostridia bacterium]